jgi:hypothetical protein
MPARRFRKKPVVIEAWQFDLDASRQADTLANSVGRTALEAWCGGSILGITIPAEQRVMHIQTLEGEMEAHVGDWIIRGVKGEFYPCKPDIFEATYERVVTLNP